MSERIEAAQLLESLAGRVEMGELYEVRSDELPVTFRAGELESIRSVQTAGRALRVIHGGRLGFSTTTDLTDKSTLVQNALACAQYGDAVSFEFPAQPPPSTVACFDSAVEGIGEQQLIGLGKEVAERLRAHDADLQIDIFLDRRIDQVHLVSTNGLDGQHASTTLWVGVEVTQTRGDDILILERSKSGRRRQDVDGSALADRLIEQLQWSERVAQVKAGAMPVVLKSEATLALLLPLLLGLNGRNVYLGTSPLGDQLGEVAFDGRLTLIDDGRLAYGVRSAPFDDEGVPTRTKELVAEGTVHQFLYDLRTAAQAGVEPTGNGFKRTQLYRGGYGSQPQVAATNWLVAPGDSSLEEILAGLEEALLVEGLIGVGQGNVLAGEFSANVGVGFLVRRGEVVGRVKNTMIAGNAYELLRDNLLALSSEREQVSGTITTPVIAVDGVSVVGAG